MIKTLDRCVIPECAFCRLPRPICVCKETASPEASRLIAPLSSRLVTGFPTGEGIDRRNIRQVSPMEEDEEADRKWLR
jgi:hypothetical protein